ERHIVLRVLLEERDRSFRHARVSLRGDLGTFDSFPSVRLRRAGAIAGQHAFVSRLFFLVSDRRQRTRIRWRPAVIAEAARLSAFSPRIGVIDAAVKNLSRSQRRVALVAKVSRQRGPVRMPGADPVAIAVEPRRHRITRSEEHTSELQSRENLVCRLLLEKKN